MKKWEDVPVEDLRAVCQRLYDGIWGDDVSMADAIKLPRAHERGVRTTADRAQMAVASIHRARAERLIARQQRLLHLDMLLLGVSTQEQAQVHAAIVMAIRDYLRPLAELIGLWDDEPDEEDDVEEDVDAPPTDGG